VANDGARLERVVVTARLRDATGKVVATAQRPVALPARAVVPVDLDAVLAAPHLWQGVDDPYLYASEVTVARNGGAALDRVDSEVGVRTVQLDPERGLLLNGRPYRVHGVNVHLTYVPGKGVAVDDADIDADYRILADLGVTGLRYAHYQHNEHSYALADRLGYLVWTELPLTSEVGGSDAFAANAAQQARELVRQNFNHPSVFVWGLGNEIYKVDEVSGRVLDAMQKLVREEDPGRPTAYANCCAPIDGPQAMHTDAVASNVYFGWYDKEFSDLAPFLSSNHARRPQTPEALSEYGAGGSALQQEDPVRRPVAASRWHPEQYQALYHEAAWRQIDAAPWLWTSFVWTGFDFASSGRNEGDGPGVNDKGLVSMDRKVRKDAYYWYQANWSKTPMVHITSRRAVRRTQADTEVKVYSNEASVRLRVNGVDLGERAVEGHIARWQVRLAPGANRIEASAGGLADNVEWNQEPGSQ
jgi:beta-galactosidase